MEHAREFALEFTEHVKEEYPENLMCNFSVGQPDENNAYGMLSDNGSHVISFNLRFTKKTERTRSITEIADQLREGFKKYPVINTFAVSTGISMGSSQSVDIEIYGYDFDKTDKFAAEIAERMRKVPGCTEVNISRRVHSEIQINFDRIKLAENGLNLTTASSCVRNRFNGFIASFYREDGDEYNIKVRYAPEFRQSIEAIETS